MCLGEVDCAGLESGSLGFWLGGRQWALNGSDLILQREGNACILALQPAYTGKPLWILGDTFLKSYHVQFDYARQRVGLACTEMNVLCPMARRCLDHMFDRILAAMCLGMLLFGACCIGHCRRRLKRRMPAAPQQQLLQLSVKRSSASTCAPDRCGGAAPPAIFSSSFSALAVEHGCVPPAHPLRRMTDASSSASGGK